MMVTSFKTLLSSSVLSTGSFDSCRKKRSLNAAQTDRTVAFVTLTFRTTAFADLNGTLSM